MNRIIIIGSPGSGKSTLARKLHDITKLPLYYLDMVFHKEDKTTLSRVEFDERLSEILKRDTWIIDGNYLRTMEKRLQRADTVIWLDYPVEVCLEGARKRVGKKRDDMPWVENGLDEEFELLIKQFPIATRPKIIELLNKYNDKEIIVFRSRADSEDFLKTLVK